MLRAQRAVVLSAFAALLLPASAACGRDEAAAPGAAAPDLNVNGVAVRLDTDVPFARQPDFPARLADVISVSLRYWGGTWSRLAGRTLVLSSDLYVPCGGVAGARGCWDGNLRISTSDPGVGALSCVEQTVLAHEIGHAVIGDPDHHDLRWMAFDEVSDVLAGRDGYGAGGAAPCAVSAGVWRHPLDSP